MIVLRHAKGWTGPKEVDGQQAEGTWRSHQVPLAETRDDAEHRRQLEEWMRSYRPEELFDAEGARAARSRDAAPRTDARRMSANPHANGGLLLQRPAAAGLPRLRGRRAERPGTGAVEATRVLGTFLRDVMAENEGAQLPRLRSRREQLEPAPGRPRGDRPRLGGRDGAGDDHLARTAG